MAGIHLALDVPRDVADAVEVGDGRTAEFHDQARHAEAKSREKRAIL
jgi:2-polyprenyl-6-hydroxyphenyl methylase/3-demethylubiquinone-9 3-methyltransferase